jgi:hypothetical protein
MVTGNRSKLIRLIYDVKNISCVCVCVYLYTNYILYLSVTLLPSVEINALEVTFDLLPICYPVTLLIINVKNITLYETK